MKFMKRFLPLLLALTLVLSCGAAAFATDAPANDTQPTVTAPNWDAYLNECTWKKFNVSNNTGEALAITVDFDGVGPFHVRDAVSLIEVTADASGNYTLTAGQTVQVIAYPNAGESRIDWAGLGFGGTPTSSTDNSVDVIITGTQNGNAKSKTLNMASEKGNGTVSFSNDDLAYVHLGTTSYEVIYLGGSLAYCITPLANLPANTGYKDVPLSEVLNWENYEIEGTSLYKPVNEEQLMRLLFAGYSCDGMGYLSNVPYPTSYMITRSVLWHLRGISQLYADAEYEPNYQALLNYVLNGTLDTSTLSPIINNSNALSVPDGTGHKFGPYTSSHAVSLSSAASGVSFVDAGGNSISQIGAGQNFYVLTDATVTGTAQITAKGTVKYPTAVNAYLPDTASYQALITGTYNETEAGATFSVTVPSYDPWYPPVTPPTTTPEITPEPETSPEVSPEPETSPELSPEPTQPVVDIEDEDAPLAPVAPVAPSDPGSTGTVVDDGEAPLAPAPKTGDDSAPVLLITALLLSLCGLTVTVLRLRRKS